MSSRDEMQRLEEAAAAFLQFRAAGGSAEECLGRHPHLRDLLEPMLAGTEAPAALAAVSGLGGRTLGDFRLQREIGRGGMGVVFAAQQLSLDRRVAVKVLPQPVALQANAIVRFKREAGVAARLQHEGIVEIYAVGATDELHWFAMELVDGIGLDQVIAECRSVPVETLDGAAVRAILDRRLGGVPRAAAATPIRTASRVGGYVASILDLVAAVADALEHAHRAGVIHRDVKPSNILLRADGRPVLTDFGLAREEGLPSISRTGEFAGTPYYVAPEQAQMRTREVDRRADVFALGVTLYELLTLSRPFEGETTQVVLQRILTREPPDPRRRNRNLSEDLVAVLMKALEKDPGRRYQTAADFAADLRAVLALGPVTARRWTRALRLRQWLRREPLKAALIGVLAAGLPALLVLGGYVLLKQEQIAAGEAGLREAAAEVMLTEGYQRLIEHQLSESEAALTRALELMPDSPEAIAGLALVARNRGDGAAAMRRFDEHPEAVRASAGLQRLRAVMQDDKAASALGTGTQVTALELFLAGMSEFNLYERGVAPAAAARKALRWFDDAVIRAPRARASYLMLRARAAAATGDRARALQSVDALLSLWPDAPRLWGGIGVVLRDFEPGRAVAAFRQAIADDPGRALMHTNLGYVLHKTGDVAGAEQAFQRALELDPGLMVTHRYYGILLCQSGRPDAGLPHLQRATEVSGGPDDYLMWAEMCMMSKRPAEAVAILERAFAAGLDNALLRQSHGHALMLLKRYDDAAVELRRACELDPRLDAAWYTLGMVLQVKRDPACLDAFRKTVEIQPDHCAAWDAIGRELMQHKQYAEAVTALEKGVAANPRYARVQSALGIALLRSGRTAEAVAPLQKAEELDRATIGYHQRVCRELARDPDQRAAVIVLCRLDLRRDPGAADSHRLLVEALRAQGDHAGLGEQLRRWAEAHDHDAPAWCAWAAFLVDPGSPVALRDPGAALAAARRAVAIAGDDVQNVLVLADALFANGDAEGALRQLDAVVDQAAAAGLGERLAEQRRRLQAR